MLSLIFGPIPISLEINDLLTFGPIFISNIFVSNYPIFTEVY